MASTHKDAEFLKEMKYRLERGRNGDPTEFEFLENMIDDWLHELTTAPTDSGKTET